jgi:hypothetical protein
VFSHSSTAWNPAEGGGRGGVYSVYIQGYASGQLAFFEKLNHLRGAVEPLSIPIDVINQMFRKGGYPLFAWDFQASSAVLKNIGFTI